MVALSKDTVVGWCSLSDDALLKELNSLNQEFAQRFQFADIDSNTRKELCVFITERSETANSSVNASLIEMLRLLARDRNGIDGLINEAVSQFIVNSSGMAEGVVMGDWTVIEQAEKCLINTLFNSSKTRDVFERIAINGLLRRLAAQLRDDFSDKSLSFIRTIPEAERVDLWFFDLRIAFISSAHSRNLQTQWREDAVAFKVFTDTIQHALDSHRTPSDTEMAPPTPHLNRAGEALKTLFNILCHSGGKCAESTVTTVTTQCCQIIRRHSELGSEMVQHAVNLLATNPVIVDLVCPKVDSSFAGPHYEARDMTVPDVLIKVVGEKLADESDSSERDLICTFFTFLLVLCTECKEARRYCRNIIIPPLTKAEVERRPDEGDTLRNQMVRAMQLSIGRDLIAEFLFVLCKRSVPRLIKYTGFGHAAGLLANQGLLGSLNQRRESDSEDSETEEYKDVKTQINPVTGYIDHRDTRPSALDGMTDEQKEYEAMKLVNAIDQMMRNGSIKPATIGPDGKPQEVGHVLELVKNVKDEKKEDSDSD